MLCAIGRLRPVQKSISDKCLPEFQTRFFPFSSVLCFLLFLFVFVFRLGYISITYYDSDEFGLRQQLGHGSNFRWNLVGTPTNSRYACLIFWRTLSTSPNDTHLEVCLLSGLLDQATLHGFS